MTWSTSGHHLADLLQKSGLRLLPPLGASMRSLLHAGGGEASPATDDEITSVAGNRYVSLDVSIF